MSIYKQFQNASHGLASQQCLFLNLNVSFYSTTTFSTIKMIIHLGSSFMQVV